jgi:mannose-6-phosphate isomerase-like protein (cupin superfamily)
MRKNKLFRSAVLLMSVFFVSAIGTSNMNALGQLTTDGDGSSANAATSAETSLGQLANEITNATTDAERLNETTMLNQTALTEQQNHTRICAPDFNGKVENIPWSYQGIASTNQTHYPALIVDIQSLAQDNHCYRDEFKTTDHTQVVLMSLKPGEEIGSEIHLPIDQLLYFVQGSGMANISGQTFPIKAGDLAYVPAGTVHNFVNTGNTDLKLFTTYSPWNHLPGVLQKTKADEAGYVPYGAEVER